MTEIYFIRHGESVGNREDRFRGRHDFPLNENGIRQAQCLRDELTRIQFDAIYTSPLSRAGKTAEILANSRNTPIIEQGFNNISLGAWENQTKLVIREKYPDLWKLWKTNPEKLAFEGMETLEMVQRRAFATLVRLVKRHPSKTIAVVSHRAVLKPLFAAMLQMNPPYFWKIQIDTASYSIAEYYQERGFTFTQINQNKHLENFLREDLG